MNEKENQALRNEMVEFVEKCRSTILSTIDRKQAPLASYAPFYRDDNGNLHVYVSQLSAHTDNLANGKANAMLIEDEAASKQIYARKRLVLDCDTIVLAKTDPQHKFVLEQLRGRHGEVIELLSSLPDFHLFRLTPVAGLFIKGFGQAYRVNATFSSIIHVDADSLTR